MNEVARFAAEVEDNVRALKGDADLQALSRMWTRAVSPYKYPYNFTWMGRPIIQLPQDIVAVQELIFRTRPEVIVETGIAHGGSLVLSASMLALLGGDREVVGVDIDIRAHNRAAIEAHPMAERIHLVEGSSIDPAVVAYVLDRARGRRTLVMLDSNHTHDHVLQELRAYSPLVRKDLYLVVFDTLVEDLPQSFFQDRPWGPGNSPRTAVREFLRENKRFVVDDDFDARLQITAAPGGWLRCVQD